MNRCLTIVLAVSMVVAFVGVAQAESGMPSQATLHAMGLSGMQVMSDHEAMNVRGMGYKSSHSTAIAFGISYAHVGGRGGSGGSIDGFLSKGSYFAGGAHGSIAGKIIIKKGGRGGHDGGGHNGGPYNGNGGHNGGGGHGGGGVKVTKTIVFAGGFAVASAH